MEMRKGGAATQQRSGAVGVAFDDLWIEICCRQLCPHTSFQHESSALRLPVAIQKFYTIEIP